MFEDDDDDEGATAPAAKFDAYGLLVLGAALAYDLHTAVGNALESFHDRLAMHANWRLARARMAAEIGKEIEAITSG